MHKILGHTAVRARQIAERCGEGDAPCDVDIDHLLLLWRVQGGRCALSGRPMTHTLRAGDDRRWNVSLDRIDSSKVYARANCQLVCVAVNRAKHDLPENEFLEMCRQVVQHNSARFGSLARAASL